MTEDLTPEQFLERRSDGESWLLLDVREAWEVATASVNGAVHIPMGEVPARLAELDGALAVAVLCHSGMRSARVAAYLAATGTERVANIVGGIDAWSERVDPAIPRY